MIDSSSIAIQKIALPVPGIDALQAEAREEGYDFIETLVEEWASGVNRFAREGEILYGAFDDGVLAAIGGVTLDPYAGDPDTGRVRRVFVRPGWRNRGVGGRLVTALVEHARLHFLHVHLRAENSNAARLYERLGFLPIADPHATHRLSFDQNSGGRLRSG